MFKTKKCFNCIIQNVCFSYLHDKILNIYDNHPPQTDRQRQTNSNRERRNSVFTPATNKIIGRGRVKRQRESGGRKGKDGKK